MATDPNAAPAQPIPEEEGELHLDPSLEHAYDQGLMSLAEARRLSGETVATQVFQFSPEAEAEAGSRPTLEVVTPDHKPQPGSKHEATLRTPAKPRNWRERAAADQPPESQRVTPHGHDYIPAVIDRR
jgi:hypothetical protein